MNSRVSPSHAGTASIRLPTSTASAGAHTGAQVPILPLANLFLVLIPFLLLSASFAPLAAAPLRLAPAQPQSDKASLTLLIRPTLFRIEPHGGGVPAARLRTLAMSVPRTLEDESGAQRSYSQLAQALTSIKQRLADVETVQVIPDEIIVYEEVMATLDVVRDLSSDLHGQHNGRAMFPHLVLGSPHTPGGLPAGVAAGVPAGVQ